MKRIKLTQGQVAIVDDDDFEWLSQWNWRALQHPSGKFRAGRAGPQQAAILMHRLICRAARDEQVDHKNGDPLDNRRSNLRVCTKSENLCNRGAQKNNTSGFKGVTWHKLTSKWMAQISVRSRHIHLGLFSTARAAGRAYKIAARKYHGEFARV